MYIPYMGVSVRAIFRKLFRKFKSLGRKAKKQARLASLGLKVALIALPLWAMPAGAATVSNGTAVPEIALAKSVTVFADTTHEIVIKPGMSNAATEAAKR